MHATTVIPTAIPLAARHVTFDAIPRADWDRLLAATSAATPFSRWTFHRAWWDAYGSTAHDSYLVVCAAGSDVIRGIVPLMYRHEVEPEDLPTHTVVREHSPMCEVVPDEARAFMFGASYHADYATVLAADEDLQAVCAAVAQAFVQPQDRFDGDLAWDVIDLRRLREIDQARPAFEAALLAIATTVGGSVIQEQEDVCPVVTVTGDTWDEYLATLDKTARHEIRRKIRRAATVGNLAIEISAPTDEAIDDFVRLHDLRFGESGLFPANEGGARSRRFIARLAELERSESDGGVMHVARVSCGERLVFVMVAFDDGSTSYLYNAGIDPEAKHSSPGVTGVALYFQDRIDAGRRRFDFLRGQERYKYEWGAVDEPIFRVLLEREPQQAAT